MAGQTSKIWMGQSIYPRNGGIRMVAQNDHGSGGGAAPTVRVDEGWSSHNDWFNFLLKSAERLPRYGRWRPRLWGAGGFSAATSLFSLLGALRKGSKKK
jgi:hypothetical protein